MDNSISVNAQIISWQPGDSEPHMLELTILFPLEDIAQKRDEFIKKHFNTLSFTGRQEPNYLIVCLPKDCHLLGMPVKWNTQE